MKKKIDALIFDVDGTLWDTTELCAEVWNDVIGEYSDLPANVTGAQLMKLFGKPMDDIFRALFPEIRQDQIDFLGSKCESHENEVLKTRSGEIYEGVQETMAKLAERVDLYIVSNCQKGYIEVCMKNLGIEHLIKDHVCFGDRHVSKGQNLRYLIEKNEIQSPCYVGDTRGDELACIEAGIPMIYAAYGFGKAQEPLGTIQSFSELLNFC